MTLSLALFLVAATAAFLCALTLAFHQNPMVSAVCMAACMVLLGVLYIGMGVPFLGFFQIIIYAGAVMVIVLYVIMALGQEEGGAAVGAPQKLFTYAAAGLFLYQVLVAFRTTRGGVVSSPEEGYGTIQRFGGLLIERYAVPFELASLLLVGAMVGAITLSRKRLP